MSAYAFPPSVVQGDSVQICVSTDVPLYDIDIRRQGKEDVYYYREEDVPGALQAVPARAYTVGCGWSPAAVIATDNSWPSGIYVVELRPGGSGPPVAYAIFVVVEDDPASSAADILYQVSITTWEAYNAWGGKSLYDHNSTDGVKADTVTFERPFSEYGGRGRMPKYDLKMVDWLEGEEYQVDYCTNLETHADPDLQSHYGLFMSVGHDEYWSKEARDNIEARIAGGQNVAFFSGDVCWWQIRFTPDLSRMICFKLAANDPLTGVDDSRVTVNWYNTPVFRPENAMTGVSFRNGGYVNSGGWYPDTLGYGGYWAYHTNHWVYAGTEIADGEVFGQEQTIVGHETDGTLFDWADGLPAPVGGDGTPLGFTILGISPASRGYGTMGIYTQGGTVFTAATIKWCYGLAENAVVEQVTRNVLNHMTTAVTGIGEEQPVAPRLLLRSAPNPFGGSTSVAFESPLDCDATLRVFDVTGRLVRTLCEEHVEPGSHAVSWRGESDDGRQAAPGVYFLSLEEGGARESQRVVKVH